MYEVREWSQVTWWHTVRMQNQGEHIQNKKGRTIKTKDSQHSQRIILREQSYRKTISTETLEGYKNRKKASWPHYQKK